ncbi:transcription elongation factor GreA [Bacillus cereus]|nr:transcription elongation factor GreA [Bacillus cereus]
MATEKTYPMTQEGKQKLENELEDLKTVKRKEVVERIKIARSFGDLRLLRLMLRRFLLVRKHLPA